MQSGCMIKQGGRAGGGQGVAILASHITKSAASLAVTLETLAPDCGSAADRTRHVSAALEHTPLKRAQLCPSARLNSAAHSSTRCPATTHYTHHLCAALEHHGALRHPL